MRRTDSEENKQREEQTAGRINSEENRKRGEQTARRTDSEVSVNGYSEETKPYRGVFTNYFIYYGIAQCT